MFETMGLQIEYLLWLQHFREITHGIFDNFFLRATWFGEFIIPLCFMAVIYWGVNKKAGTFLLFNYALMLYINVFLKMTACINRPWIIDSRVSPLPEALPLADGYSFPSGHTAGATAVWGGSAFVWWKKKIIRYLMIFLVILVAFSRNYVGVHTPQDVIVSMIVGIFMLFGTDKLLKWIDKKKNNDIIFFAAIILLTLLLYIYIHIKCCFQLQSFNSLTDLINPIAMKHTAYGKIGFLAGIFTGWILERRFVRFEIPQGSDLRKIIFITGGLIILYLFAASLHDYLGLVMAKQIASAIVAFLTSVFIMFLYPCVLKRFL